MSSEAFRIIVHTKGEAALQTQFILHVQATQPNWLALRSIILQQQNCDVGRRNNKISIIHGEQGLSDQGEQNKPRKCILESDTHKLIQQPPLLGCTSVSMSVDNEDVGKGELQLGSLHCRFFEEKIAFGVCYLVEIIALTKKLRNLIRKLPNGNSI